MESESNSPSYNILAPRPWTSFKETPPSPLLVLRKREVKSPAPAPPPPVSPIDTEMNGSRRTRKKKAPSPPVRSSSLKSSGNEESDKEEDIKTKIEIKNDHNF